MREGYCHCGMAAEDPLHYGWHKIKMWNADVFDRSRQKAMQEFESRLPKKKKQEQTWKSLDI